MLTGCPSYLPDMVLSSFQDGFIGMWTPSPVLPVSRILHLPADNCLAYLPNCYHRAEARPGLRYIPTIYRSRPGCILLGKLEIVDQFWNLVGIRLAYSGNRLEIVLVYVWGQFEYVWDMLGIYLECALTRLGNILGYVRVISFS